MARQVSVRGTFNNWQDAALTPLSNGHWMASVKGVKEGDQYKYFVAGIGSVGFKRDPYARSIADQPSWPDSNCNITQPKTFLWHDQEYRPPPFNQIVLYQLHVGTYYSVDQHGIDRRRSGSAHFLDLLFRLEYLSDLGINAIQLLPIQEFSSPRSMGYNGCDYFSPEMDYAVRPSDPDLQRYVQKANDLLAARGQPPFKMGDLVCQTKQLMAVIDLYHLYGIAVILDVVYNHAGGGFDDESMYFFDRQASGDNNRSLYFTDQGWAGGLVFAFWNADVRQFLINNALFFIEEYHVDGFRFDEVTVIDRFGGWRFLQDITDTIRYKKAVAIQIAEYWGDQSAVLRARENAGAGFDAVVAAGLRNAIRGVVAQAAHGRDAEVNFDPLRDALYTPFAAGWQFVQHLENQDVVRANNDSDRQPRVPVLADPSNPKSWYARSRSRVANGLLLAAPGIPMLFMGQELLEDKYWSDSPNDQENTLIWWDGLNSDSAMRDHLRFIREILAVRKRLPALCGDRIDVFHVHNDNRVFAFHRWCDGTGDDVIIVINLREETWWQYNIGFPFVGEWREVFNSDIYDQWVNPIAAGNGGSIFAINTPTDGFAASATIVIPANSILMFAH